ncbi:hypothetical protein G4B88_019380 [Cannabis sativa]|uniref:MBD domain-containing protein n=1 Tax=Cannabis sativa TaxID=3483 RepID=A0A7J6HZE5_CANSA|nr:hypothetical protein G4B88_019380 [Cannabis sativa]
MPEPKSHDGLPPGWKVKVKVRPDGRKKDKYYSAPSNGPTFNSRVEALRYLGTPLNNHDQLKKKNKATSKQAQKIQYTDPFSKNVFHSMKAVIQYVETEEQGMVAQNTKGSTEKDLEDNKTFSTSVIQQSAVSKARRHINFSQSSNMNDIEQEEQPHSSTQLLAPSEHEDQCETGVAMSNSDLQEAQVQEPKRGEGGNAVSPSKKYPKDQLINPENEKAEHGLCKSKKEKVPELPRRASKRLAGLEVDPVPELRPRTRARRAAVEQSCDEVAGLEEDPMPELKPRTRARRAAVEQSCDEVAELELDPVPELKPRTRARRAAVEQSHDKVAGTDKDSAHGNGVTNTSKTAESEEQVGNVEAITNCSKNQGSHGCSLASENPRREQQRNVESGDTKLGFPIDLPFHELLTDPCIAFAIRTLTGINFGCSESSEVLPGSITSSEHFSVNMASDMFKVETDNMVGTKGGSSKTFPSGNISSLEEHSESETRADEKLVSPIEFPSEESWQDPCIEFAIKTLTDDIPENYEQNIQQYFEQQLSLGGPGQSDHNTSLIDKFCQAEYSRQPFHNVVEKPAPALMHKRTASNRQSSRRSVRNKNGKERQ